MRYVGTYFLITFMRLRFCTNNVMQLFVEMDDPLLKGRSNELMRWFNCVRLVVREVCGKELFCSTAISILLYYKNNLFFYMKIIVICQLIFINQTVQKPWSEIEFTFQNCCMKTRQIDIVQCWLIFELTQLCQMDQTKWCQIWKWCEQLIFENWNFKRV